MSTSQISSLKAVTLEHDREKAMTSQLRVTEMVFVNQGKKKMR